SHLVERLLRDGHHVHVVDNLSTSPLPLDLLLNQMGNPERLSYDVCDFHTWRRDLNIEQIYHLASPVGPAGVLKHTGHIVSQIVRDSYHAAALAVEYSAKLLDVSTSEVYGGGINGLCSEDMPRIIQAETTSRLEYAVGKLAGETALLNLAQISDLELVIIRPFNVAGPRQSEQGGFVLPRFVQQALRGEALTIFGSGEQVRAFTHVRDIVNGLVLAMERGSGVYNLGNPANKISIRLLAAKVVSATGSKSRAIFTDGQSIYGPLYSEAHDKFPSSRKAMTELGWQPSQSIDDTIADVVAYHREAVAV
ncbi:MAG: NAD-dependent epimerase/dehydratase family protein, partial [Anaerolineae bacterium]|nr:NAD-dependent epimerase/dehydratase family protein [Anaerolineae bacterium]